jgi:hypothetical protein
MAKVQLAGRGISINTPSVSSLRTEPPYNIIMDQYTGKSSVEEIAVSLNPVDEAKHETPHQTDKEAKYLNHGEIFPFSISPSYVKDWDTVAAFRELYQNW